MNRRLPYLFLLFVFTSCQHEISAPKAADLSMPVITYKATPLNVVQYLKSKFPAYHLLNKADYSKLWWSFYSTNESPYLVSSDFNNDAVADYAAIISNNKTLKLVILIGEKISFSHWIAPDFSVAVKSPGVGYGLSIQPPAQIDAVHPLVQTLYLKNNGVLVNNYEMHNRIYYYEDQQFKTFMMATTKN